MHPEPSKIKIRRGTCPVFLFQLISYKAAQLTAVHYYN